MSKQFYVNDQGKYVYPYDPEWDDGDEYVEVRKSNLRRSRNAHLGIGAFFGCVGTLAAIFLYFWAWVGV